MAVGPAPSPQRTFAQMQTLKVASAGTRALFPSRGMRQHFLGGLHMSASRLVCKPKANLNYDLAINNACNVALDIYLLAGHPDA